MSKKLESLKKDVEALKEKLRNKKKERGDATLKEIAGKENLPVKEMPRVRRTLKGHLAKIYALHWSYEPKVVVSASQDGKLLVWDAVTSNKLAAVPLKSSWVMTCAYSPSNTFVACGGLDNVCSIYNLTSKDTPIKVARELNAHTGYLSCCRFLDDEQILTSSGDSTCILWNISTGSKVREYLEHAQDVVSISLHPDKNTFVSGGVDKEAKIWDLKSGRSVQTFWGHSGDINSIQFMRNGFAFASGSDDSTCRLFDIRADREAMVYQKANFVQGVTAMSFSHSGRYLITAYDNFAVFFWDSLKGEVVYELTDHQQRVSCLGVNVDGTALCTGCWDQQLRIFA